MPTQNERTIDGQLKCLRGIAAQARVEEGDGQGVVPNAAHVVRGDHTDVGLPLGGQPLHESPDGVVEVHQGSAGTAGRFAVQEESGEGCLHRGGHGNAPRKTPSTVENDLQFLNPLLVVV